MTGPDDQEAAMEDTAGTGARPDGPPAEAGAADPADLPGGVRSALEAVLMVVDEPVPAERLAAVVGAPVAEVLGLLAGLRAEYDGAARGFELREAAGGWRVYSRREFAPWVSRFVLDGQTARLTQAALETLAIVAYRQPVTRARIAAIRGVNADSVVRTLLARGLVAEAGTDPETGATLYSTTPFFLERLGIGSVSELPRLSPHLPGVEQLGDFDTDDF